MQDDKLPLAWFKGVQEGGRRSLFALVASLLLLHHADP